MSVDFLDALTAYLAHDAGVAALAGARVFPAELPAAEAASMPRGTIVLIPTGGLYAANNVPLQAPRVDVTCYGATPQQARLLSYAAQAALVSLARDAYAQCLLHSAVQGGGPLAGRTPEGWPYLWSSWIVRAGVEPVS